MTDKPSGPLRDLVVHRIPTAELILFPGNARRGDIDKIARSLATNGQYRPIIVRRETGEILAGNHTYQAARQLGWDSVLVTYLDGLADADARKIVLVDNKTNDAAGYDEHALAELLASLEGDYDGTGFEDRDEIAALLAQLADEPEAKTDVDDIPETPTYDPLSQVGQSWDLGPHRLVVGDATDPQVIATATGGELAEMTEGGWLYKQDLVWIKDRFVLSRQDYHWQHEPCLYGWKPGAAHRWRGGFTPSTVIDGQRRDPKKMTKAELLEIVEQAYATTTAIREPRPARNEDHPTSKPVGLLTRLIDNSSVAGDLVLDPFGGSGSTLIAAHATKRRAATVELDPRYADVIARRFQAHTGVLPIDTDGRAVDFLAHHRKWKAQAEETG